MIINLKMYDKQIQSVFLRTDHTWLGVKVEQSLLFVRHYIRRSRGKPL